MGIKFNNYVQLQLTDNVDQGDLEISVDSTDRLPDLTSPFDYMYLVLISETTKRREIVRVDSYTNNILTVVRAQDDTTAGQFYQGDTIESWITAQSLRDLVSIVELALVRTQKDIFTVTATDVLNGYLTLTVTPTDDSVLVFPVGGVNQVEGVDYTIVGNQVVFLNVDALFEGSLIEVMYEYPEEI